MPHEIRKRIVRPATPDEKERHQRILEQVQQELPELLQWARTAASNHGELVSVGTVLTDKETHVLQAIDNYAATQSLKDRGAVVRQALAKLLGIEIARQ